jgi:hypothetical protein
MSRTKNIPIKIKPNYFQLLLVFGILSWLIIASNNIVFWFKFFLLAGLCYLVWFRLRKYVYVEKDSFLFKSHFGFLCKEIKFQDIKYIWFNKPAAWHLDASFKVFYDDNKSISISLTTIDIIDKILPYLIKKQVRFKVGDSSTTQICYERATEVVKSE